MNRSQSFVNEHASPRLEPLRPLPALARFLLAGLLFRFALYNAIPWLIGRNVHPMAAMTLALGGAFMFLLVLAGIELRCEARPWAPRALIQRLRLERPKGRHWILTVLALVATGIMAGLLAPTRSWLANLPSLRPPEGFPSLLDPVAQQGDLVGVTAAWLGPPASPQALYVGLALFLFTINIVGEEIYWRGVLLPRQEAHHGSKAWWIHGLMWNLFHLPFYPWYLVFGLSLALPLSWLATRTGNNWPPIVMHSILNGAMLFLLISLVT